MKYFDPFEKAKEIEGIVSKGILRKYYRMGRAGRWYGGIATADCLGCNLNCIFCWSGKPRDNPEKFGNFYSPEEVANELIKCARKNNYHLLRLSGNEPTIAKDHLLKFLEILSKENYLFILETNGTLLNYEFIRELKNFKKVHIRVSLKGAEKNEFSKLTGAYPETFDIILENIKILSDYNLKFNIAIMLSFSNKSNILKLKEILKKISSKIIENFEEEYVILYPIVKKRLKEANILPAIAFSPDGMPENLI